MLRAMAVTSPSYLPVIKTITDSAGGSMRPVDELRIMPGLTATLVTGDGPDRIELDTYAADPDYLPLASLVPQPALAATGNSVVLLARANSEGPSLIRQLDLFLTDSVPASMTDFRSVQILDVDPVAGLGSPPMVVEYEFTAGIDPVTSPISWTPYELAAGHFLAASWESHGTGAAYANGVWEIKQ